MTISTVTMPNQQRAPVFPAYGARLSPRLRGSGATTTVEYTLGSQSDVINNVATWVTWPSGATAITRSDRSNEPMYIRATSAGGASVLTINDSPGIVSALVRDWASQSNIGTVSVLGQQNIAVSKSDADANESAALYSLLIPAGTLGANSMLRIRVLWTVPNSAATKRLRGRFGGTVLWNYDRRPIFLCRTNSSSRIVTRCRLRSRRPIRRRALGSFRLSQIKLSRWTFQQTRHSR